MLMCEIDGGKRWISLLQSWTDRGPLALTNQLAVDGLTAPADAVYNWLAHGQVPARRDPSGRWCIPWDPDTEAIYRRKVAASFRLKPAPSATTWRAEPVTASNLDALTPEGKDPDMGNADPVDNEELRTPRLSLRRPTRADIDTIYRVHSNPRACAHNPADALASRAEAEALYRRWNEHWHQHGFGYWTVHSHVPTDQPLGFCGIKLMQLHGRTILNLFYRLDPLAWGTRVATEAATAVVDWATAHLPDRPLIARVRPDNTASLKVAARAGLRRAPELDTAGEDGLDWIFMSNWPDNADPAHDLHP